MFWPHLATILLLYWCFIHVRVVWIYICIVIYNCKITFSAFYIYDLTDCYSRENCWDCTKNSKKCFASMYSWNYRFQMLMIWLTCCTSMLTKGCTLYMWYLTYREIFLFINTLFKYTKIYIIVYTRLLCKLRTV